MTISANQSTRWLGIWLDSKLSFLDHATKWLTKAVSVSTFLRWLNNTHTYSSSQPVRKAIKASAIPIALYSTEVLYLGTTKLAWCNGKWLLKNSQNDKQVSRINRAVISGLRAILPVYKTIHWPILNSESGILPKAWLLKNARIHQALWIRSLDEFNPLRQRATKEVHTRLDQLAKLPWLHDSDISMLLQYVTSS